MITVALADDHLQMRSTVAGIINQVPGYHVDLQAADGFSLLTQFRSLKKMPAVAVIDIGMPVMDGLAVTNFMHSHYPEIAVIVLSMYSHHTMVKETLEAGAKGYILKKNISIAVLQRALQTVTTGEIFIDDSLQSDASYQQIPGTDHVSALSGKADISQREKTFLQLASTSISYDEIAQLMNVGKESIYNYQKSLREKLGISTRQEFMLFAIQHGFAKVARLYT